MTGVLVFHPDSFIRRTCFSTRTHLTVGTRVTMATRSEAMEEGDEPGAAPYGNFRNYYTFNPPENRLSLIPATLLRDLDHGDDQDEATLVLDVGCNSGVSGWNASYQKPKNEGIHNYLYICI